MIDEALTESELGTKPYAGTDRRVKNRYRMLDYVVVRCDVCNAVYGKDGRVLLMWVLQRRKQNGGRDLCTSCWRDERNPLRHFDNAKAAFLILVRKNDGKVPPRSRLPYDLINAINSYYGGYAAFRDRCGLPSTMKPRHWWKDWANLKAELLPICEELGIFPPDQYLLDIKATSLRSALKYFGGAKKIAKRLGFKLGTGYEADDGHFVFSYYEFAVDNLLFYHRVPHQPHPTICDGDKRRGDFRVGDTIIEVAGYARGTKTRSRQYHKRLREKEALYASLGIPVIVVYKEDFDDIDVVVKKLEPLIRQYGDKTRQVDIENALRPVSWWADWDNVAKLLEEAIKELGHFPVARELEKTGRSCVVHYIMKLHGGLAQARRRMGARVNQEAPGFFAEWENVRKTFLPICEQLGYFPSPNQIRSRRFGTTDCVTVLYKYWGSIPAVAAKLGYPTQGQFMRTRKDREPCLFD